MPVPIDLTTKSVLAQAADTGVLRNQNRRRIKVGTRRKSQKGRQERCPLGGLGERELLKEQRDALLTPELPGTSELC